MDNTFDKKYKLCHPRHIEELYSESNAIKHFPYVVKVRESKFDDSILFKAVIATPKRVHKSAVARNKIKRLTREALRLNKAIIEDYLKANEGQLALFFIYTSKDVLSFELLNKKMVQILHKIVDSIDANNK